MPLVKFLNDGIAIEVKAGTRLIDACDEAQASLPFGCAAGNCGTCLFTPVEGGDRLDPPGEMEEATLEGIADTPDQRLACQCAVRGDLSVRYD